MPQERLIPDDYIFMFQKMSIKELTERRDVLMNKLNILPYTSGSIRKAMMKQIKDLDYYIQNLRNNK